MLTPNEHIYLLGDFNARVCAEHNTWPMCIGHHGLWKINENGERLLELCCNRNLCVTNTYFQVKQKHRVSWMHPRSRQWHQRNLVITKRELLNSIHITRTYHSADCDTDHSLVLSKITLSPKSFIMQNQKSCQRSIPATQTTLKGSSTLLPPLKAASTTTCLQTQQQSGIISAMQHTKLQWKHMVGGSEIMPTDMR